MPISVFDSSAAGYDQDFTHTLVGRLQRGRVYKYLFPLLTPHTKLLEVNCGTGFDATQLAPRVASVLATDISPAMVAVAQEKITRLNLRNAEARIADINELPPWLNGNYNLLLSNFGGLNCLSPEQLSAFAKNISPFISPDGKLALVLMGKKCIVENAWYLLRKDARLNRRNTDKAVMGNVNGNTFSTFYYSTAELAGIFSGNFTVIKKRPVGLFIPPSYLNDWFGRHKILMAFMRLLDGAFGWLPFLSDYADHFILMLEKKDHSRV